MGTAGNSAKSVQNDREERLQGTSEERIRLRWSAVHKISPLTLHSRLISGESHLLPEKFACLVHIRP